jgi:hypothetical protein
LESHQYVFVCGLQRSGTTMLYRYLGEHPSIAALQGTPRPANEGQHNQSVYPADDLHSKAGMFAFRPEARFTEDSPLATPENAETLYREWSRYWDTSRPMLMEKSPPNLIRMRFLQALFPESAFVVIMRHPIPVSLATQKWSDTKPHSLIEHWLRAHELMAEDAPHVRGVHVMRYEDLVADPDSELRDVFGFLGLEDHGAGRTTAEGLNTDNFQADRTLRTGVNDRYFDDWDGPRRHTIVRRAYYDLTERRYERRARQFGYSLRRPHELRTPTLRLPGLSDRGPRPAVAASSAR